MYYGLLSLSVIMFGIQFLLNSLYGKESGNKSGATFVLSFIGGIIGVISLTIINGFAFEATPFTILMATLAALNSILYTFCALKSFQRINLSLYSLFAMLGGMILPFFQGIIFYGEPITLAKCVCVLFIAAALVLCTSRSDKKGGFIYYIGVFVLNGMSGVLTKIFQSSSLPKTSSAMYSVWSAAILTLLTGTVILVMFIISKTKKQDRSPLPKLTFKLLACASGCGILGNVANYFLLIALVFLPASVQYPFITGGVMIVSTIISAITGAKPSKKEILAVALSFIGIIALVLIPI